MVPSGAPGETTGRARRVPEGHPHLRSSPSGSERKMIRRDGGTTSAAYVSQTSCILRGGQTLQQLLRPAVRDDEASTARARHKIVKEPPPNRRPTSPATVDRPDRCCRVVAASELVAVRGRWQAANVYHDRWREAPIIESIRGAAPQDHDWAPTDSSKTDATQTSSAACTQAFLVDARQCRQSVTGSAVRIARKDPQELAPCHVLRRRVHRRTIVYLYAPHGEPHSSMRKRGIGPFRHYPDLPEWNGPGVVAAASDGTGERVGATSRRGSGTKWARRRRCGSTISRNIEAERWFGVTSLRTG